MPLGQGLDPAALQSLAQLMKRPTRAQDAQMRSQHGALVRQQSQQRFASEQRELDFQRQTDARNVARNDRADEIFQRQQDAEYMMERQFEMSVEARRQDAAFKLQNTMAKRGKGVSAQPGGTQYMRPQGRAQLTAASGGEQYTAQPEIQDPTLEQAQASVRQGMGFNRFEGIEVSPEYGTIQTKDGVMTEIEPPLTTAQRQAQSPMQHVREGLPDSEELRAAYTNHSQQGTNASFTSYQNAIAAERERPETLEKIATAATMQLERLYRDEQAQDRKDDPAWMAAVQRQQEIKADAEDEMREIIHSNREFIPPEGVSKKQYRLAMLSADRAVGEDNRDSPEYEEAVRAYLRLHGFIAAAKAPAEKEWQAPTAHIDYLAQQRESDLRARGTSDSPISAKRWRQR